MSINQYYKHPCIEIGKRLRELREAAHLHQADLAEMAGLAEITVVRAEHGCSVNAETLMLIANALDADLTITRRLP